MVGLFKGNVSFSPPYAGYHFITGGATTNGPDATPPQLSVKTWGGGGGGGRGELWRGGRLGGVGGDFGRGGGGGFQGGGACARPTTTTCIPHWGLCVWGFGGTEVCMR